MTSQPAAPVAPHAARVHHPAFVAQRLRRYNDVQLRIADKITAFAGSMGFVYIHTVIFGAWVGTGLFGADPFPFNFLTLVVSLEAIFLSAFVLIGQNRQGEFAQAKADHDFVMQEKGLEHNTELTRQIQQLTQEIHDRVVGGAS
jgi:uncharacterized membrane protein